MDAEQHREASDTPERTVTRRNALKAAEEILRSGGFAPSPTRGEFSNSLSVCARNSLSAEQGVPSAAQRSRHDSDLARADPLIGK